MPRLLILPLLFLFLVPLNGVAQDNYLRDLGEARRLYATYEGEAWRQAEAILKRLLGEAEVQSEPVRVATVSETLARLMFTAQRSLEGRRPIADAVRIYEELGDQRGLGRALQLQARIFITSDALRQAQPLIRRALEVLRSVGDDAMARLVELDAAYFVYEHDPGMVILHRSYDYAIETQEQDLLAWSAFYLATSYSREGKIDVSLDFYREAAAAANKVGDFYMEARCVGNSAYVLRQAGRFEEAMTLGTRANELWRKMAHPSRAATLVTLAAAHSAFGEHHLALKTTQEAQAIIPKTASQNLMDSVLINMGIAYINLGDLEEGERLFREIYPRFARRGSFGGQVMTIRGLSDALLGQERWAEALGELEKALEPAASYGNPRLVTLVYENLGAANLGLGNLEEAMCWFEEALNLNIESKLINDQARVLRLMGEAYARMEDFARSREFLHRSLVLLEQTGDREESVRVRFALSRTQQRLGDLPGALNLAREVIQDVESLRGRIMADYHRLTYTDQIAAFYVHLIDLILGLNPDEASVREAYAVAQRYRARNLVDNLTALAEWGGTDAAVDRERVNLRRQIRQLALNRITAAANESKAQRAAREDEIQALLARERQLIGESRQSRLKGADVMSIDRIQKELVAQDEVILEFLLGEKRGFLWMVDRNQAKVVFLPPRAQLEARVTEVLDHLSARNLRVKFESWLERDQRIKEKDAAYPSKALQLSNMLLREVLPLMGDRRMVIIADGALQYLPFAALPHPNSPSGETEWQPLMLQHDIYNAPSTAVLHSLRGRADGRGPGNKSLAVFGDPVFSPDDPRVRGRSGSGGNLPIDRVRELNDRFPRLPHTRREAEVLPGLLPKDQTFVALDFDAAGDTLAKLDLSRYSGLHFATHGIIDPLYPELSGLVLSLVDQEGRPSQGFLSQGQIYDLDLKADLVVLSACRTAVGRIYRGEGMVGLTHGFMSAGATRVLASVWQIEDRATADLMLHFYQLRLGEGLDEAAALRRAQMRLFRGKEYRAPYYWGAFLLQGPGS